MNQPRALERYHLYVMRDDVKIVVASFILRSQARSIVRAFPLDTWLLSCEYGGDVKGDSAAILRRLARGRTE